MKWIEVHPYKNNQNAQLWITTRKQKIDSNYQYAPLNEGMILHIVHKTADLVGIKKRITPHLFRHTAATRLSQDLNEAQLRMFLGWDAGSTMPATYVHLSGHNLENAILATHGLVEQESTKTKIEKCPRCRSITTPKARYCDICGFPLTKSIEQDNNIATTDFIAFLSQKPEILAEVLAKAKQ